MKKLSVLLLVLLSFTFMGCLSTPEKENEAPKEKIVLTVINKCNWKIKLSFFLENNDPTKQKEYTPVYNLGREPQTVELVKDADYELGIMGAYDITPSRYGIHIGDTDIWIFDWDSYEGGYVIYTKKSEDLQE